MIYNSLILPHFYYSLLAWGSKCHKIEILQKRAIRVAKFIRLAPPILSASNNYPQSSLNYAAQPFTAPPYPGHYKRVSRLPLPKPPIFHGDVLEFPQ